MNPELRIKPSDPRYARMDALADMQAVLANPKIHVIGYGQGETPIDLVTRQFFTDADIAEIQRALNEAQDALIYERVG